jgi:endo-1,4-beta-xylanase
VVDLDSATREGITRRGSLKAHASRSGLLTGAAAEAQLLATNAAVEKIVTDQYSILVAENSMKGGPMRPAPDKFSFEAGDALVAFGDAHGIKVRGHNLCWHANCLHGSTPSRTRTMRSSCWWITSEP